MSSSSNRKGLVSTDWFKWGSLVFVIALACRLTHLFQILPAPFFPFKMGDAASYDAWAQQIAAGDWLGTDVFYQAPLYPYFLGVVYSVAGDDMFSIRLCQAFVGSLSCVLLAAAGWRIFSRPVGVLSGLVLACYAPSLFFDSLVQKSVLDEFFLCLTLLCFGFSLRSSRTGLWIALGASIGGLVLARENAMVVIPAALIWLAFRRDLAARRRWQSAGWLLGGVAVVLLPVAARNWAVGGEFHLTTSQFGPNFYIGNNEQANGTYRPLRPHRGSAKHERRDAQQLAEEAIGRPLSAAEVSRYWSDRTLAFIRREPGKWIKLLTHKFVLTWNAVELVDTEDQYTYAEWSWLLWLAGYVLHFGVLVPLATFGIWCTWNERRNLLFLYLVVAFYALSVIAFYVVGRYRYPLVPPLILLAAAGIICSRKFVLEAPKRLVIGALLSATLVAIFCNYPISSKDQMRATTHYNVGVELDERQLIEAANGEYQRALELSPHYDAVHNNLGANYLAMGQVEAAIGHLQAAVTGDPDFTEAVYNLGAAYLAADDLTRAARCFERLVQRKPNLAQGHFGMGIVRSRQGKNEEAAKFLRRALEIDPRFESAHDELKKIESHAE